MQVGSTFLLTAVDDHLWIVLSDPEKDAQTVLLVSVTTWRSGKDPSCKIQRGEHPFVIHESCVHYIDARDARLAQLYVLKDTWHLQMREPLPLPLLERVHHGASVTKHLKLKYQQLLIDQGFIEPTPF